MSLPVSLHSVAEEMDVPSETFRAYVNRRTGELFTVSDDEAALVDQDPADLERLPDWQQDLLPKVREVLESGGIESRSMMRSMGAEPSAVSRRWFEPSTWRKAGSDTGAKRSKRSPGNSSRPTRSRSSSRPR